VGDDPAGCGEAKGLRPAIQLPPKQPWLAPHGAGFGIYLDAFHSGQIHDDAIVANAAPGNTMTATADRERQACLSSELDAGDYVSQPATPHDEGWSTVNHAVPDLAGLIVAGIPAPKCRTTYPVNKRSDAIAVTKNRGL
jgi:hypothetical protein